VVQQVFTEDLTQHITTIEQRVLSAAGLSPWWNGWDLPSRGKASTTFPMVSVRA